MLNPKSCIIYGMLLICIITVTRTGNHLVNDTCHTVQIKGDITKKPVKVVCNKDDKVFDPESKNGSYLFDNGTQNWTGEIFACLCSCHLPVDLENGQFLSENRSIILHGEALNYSCNDGYEKNEKKIVCYDGLLMTVPDHFEKQHINISFRQKSLPESFANGEVFHLLVNKAANWSFPETEVRNKQKVFESRTENDTILLYYLFNGDGYMLGFVDVEMGKGLQCTKIPTASDKTGNLVEVIAPLVIVVILLIASLLIAVVIVKKRRVQKLEVSKPKTQLKEDIKEEEKQPMHASGENIEDDD